MLLDSRLEAAAVVARRHAQVLGAVAAEVAQRGKVHAVANLGERQALVLEKAFENGHSGAVNVGRDGVPRESLDGSREVLGRHVEALGIVVHAALGDAHASAEQLHEQLHDIAGAVALLTGGVAL